MKEDTQTLAEEFEKLSVDEGIDAFSVEQFCKEHGVPVTLKFVKNMKDEISLYKCNECRFYYDTKQELMKHLKKEKHYLNTDTLRERKEALWDRIYPGESDGSKDYFTKRQKDYPFNFEEQPACIRLTFIELAIDRAYMEYINRKKK